MFIAFINSVGRFTLHICEIVGNFTLFFVQFLKTLTTTPLKIHKVFVQMQRIGVESLAISVLTGWHVQKGKEIGNIGTWRENGHWGPHLHIQLYRDVDKVTDWAEFMAGPFDGYGKVSELTYWAKHCPDPTPLIFI